MISKDAETINEVAAEVHANAVAKGWHQNEPQMLTIGEVSAFVANVHGEVAELWEAARNNELFTGCDKGIPLTCMEEELADIVIRVFDFASKRGLRIGDAIKVKHKYNESRPHRHGGKLA